MPSEKHPAPNYEKLIERCTRAIAKELDPEAPACEAFVNIVSVDIALYTKEHRLHWCASKNSEEIFVDTPPCCGTISYEKIGKPVCIYQDYKTGLPIFM